jgi:internalin A
MNMSDLLDAGTSGSSPKHPSRRMPVTAGIVVLLILVAACSLPYWIIDARRRSKEAWTRDQMAKVKAGSTTCISNPDPDLIGELVDDGECADKITEVWIGEAMGERIADERLRDLKRLPHLRSISVSYVRTADPLLANIEGMSTLEELSLYKASVSAAGTRHLASFPHLKRLLLYNRVDSAALDALKNHAGIETLYFTGNLTAEQAAALRTLPNLRHLTLHVEPSVSGVLDLRGMPKLESLNLGGGAATDAALAGLREMENLTDLFLDDSMVTNAGLVHLRTNRNLKRLSLSGQPKTESEGESARGQFALAGRPITGAGLAQLTGLTALEELDISKTRVGDDGLQHLKALAKLRKLDLSGTRVTEEDANNLQRALPQCEIKRK